MNKFSHSIQVTCGTELAVLFVETLVKGKFPYDNDTLGQTIPFEFLSIFIRDTCSLHQYFCIVRKVYQCAMSYFYFWVLLCLSI